MSTVRVLLLYLLYIVLIGGITTVIVLSLHSGNKPKVHTKPVTQTQVATPSQSTTPSKPSAGSATSNAGSAASQSVASAKNNTAIADSGQLVNTGPGDVAAVFAGTVVIGYVAYRRHLVANS